MTQSTAWRPQAPSISDPVAGDADLWEPGQENEVVGIEEDQTTETPKRKIDWKKRAKDSYRFSTSYVDSNYRKQWDDAIRAFNNQHPGDSKYSGEMFRKRSNLFRPKTRAIIRKNEAAAAAAFFSNMDLIDVSAPNQSDKAQVISGEMTKQLLQYRLTKTIPWFQFVCGGLQDGQVQGAVCAHVHWKFLERHSKDGSVAGLEDYPCAELIPIENIRIDPSASWYDPINTSPYLIHLIPMYWCDVKDRMEYENPKGQKWKKYPPSVVFAKSDNSDDSTRMARTQLQQDPTQQKREVSDYDIVWIHRHIHRHNAQDFEFYTIASERLLTEAKPLEDTVWHGERPYIMGRVMIETHRALPNPVPTLIRPLQDEANTLANSRLDNIHLILNKRYIAKRGKNVDLVSLVRNVPGGITLADDPEGDIRELEWNDVTQSSYLEQDRIDGDFSDLVGNFNPMQVQAQRTGRESTNTMRMLEGPSNLLTEYMLKTYVETFIQPVLRHIVMLEQHYETDITLLALAGEKAKVWQKYGTKPELDAILDRELSVTVNVGMGATDMVAKLTKFLQWLGLYHKLSLKPPPGIDMKEVWKEGCALTGYQDGARFIVDGSDPGLAAAQAENMQLKQMLQKLMIDKNNKHEANQVKLKTSRETNLVKLAAIDKQSEADARMMLVEHLMSQENAGAEREDAVEDRNFEAAMGERSAEREDKRADKDRAVKSRRPNS